MKVEIDADVRRVHQCTAYCRDGLHATMVGLTYETDKDGLYHILDLMLVNRTYRLWGVGPCDIIDAFPAREWQPPAEAPRARFGWVLLVKSQAEAVPA